MIRTKRYKIQSSTIILYKGKLYESKEVQNYGNYVTVKDSKKAFPTRDVTIIKQPNGWINYKP